MTELSYNITPSSSSPGIFQTNQHMDYLKAHIISNKNNYNSTFLKTLGFSIDQMLISCYFNKKRCTSADFNWVYSYEYGNCYSFNFKLNSSTTFNSIQNSGPSYGIYIKENELII
jgi:hypothetical protein